MSGSDAEMHQTLGGLKATVDHLNTTVNNMVTMWGNQEKNATEGRRLVYEKVDSLRDSVVALTNRVGSLETTMIDVKPAVEEFENQRQQQKGAMKVGRIIWGAMLAAAGGIGWGLHEWLTLPKPPH